MHVHELPPTSHAAEVREHEEGDGGELSGEIGGVTLADQNVTTSRHVDEERDGVSK